jgi:hypothetical protein
MGPEGLTLPQYEIMAEDRKSDLFKMKMEEPRMNTNRHEFAGVRRILPFSRIESNSCSFVSIRGSFLAGFVGNSAKLFQFG